MLSFDAISEQFSFSSPDQVIADTDYDLANLCDYITFDDSAFVTYADQ